MPTTGWTADDDGRASYSKRFYRTLPSQCWRCFVWSAWHLTRNKARYDTTWYNCTITTGTVAFFAFFCWNVRCTAYKHMRACIWSTLSWSSSKMTSTFALFVHFCHFYQVTSLFWSFNHCQTSASAALRTSSNHLPRTCNDRTSAWGLQSPWKNEVIQNRHPT